jgi:cell division protein ZapA (FtsZ GTPase activity inhibitor)
MILLTLIILAIMVLLTSCDTTRFIQCNKNFRKKVENLNQRLTGAQYYRLEPISSKKINEE